MKRLKKQQKAAQSQPNTVQNQASAPFQQQQEATTAQPPQHPVYKQYPQTITLKSVTDESLQSANGQLQEESNDFTPGDFAKVWNDFAKAESARRPRLSALLCSQIPPMPDNGLIFRFKVDSMTVKDYLKKNIHNALEGYLRANLHNSGIVLRFELEGEQTDDSANEGTKKENLPYTSKEKYVYMLEKNPALKLLRDTFDLETD
ncbi:MAG: hypothetical protein IKO46_11875 [Salinivirgaceae bacterium]|nr:hypothetical protein [Salinivirgaceae bacterium]MBR6083159.1 hypothetical protein [Salinivirgaceae bacterium]